MARAALGLGVRELAAAAGVSPDTVARFERGDSLRDQKVDTIRAALEALGAEFTDGDSLGVRVRRRPFYLAPVDPTDSVWETSPVRGGLWVLATSEHEARLRAAMAIVTAVMEKQGAPDKRVLGLPWQDAGLVACKPRDCPFPLALGAMLDDSGAPIVGSPIRLSDPR